MATSNTLLLNIKREIIENRKKILLSVGTLWGICIFMGGYFGFYHRGGGISEVFIFSLVLVLSGYVYASTMFSDMTRKESRIATLMLPASSFDKFITRWIAVVPVLFGILVAGFYLGDIARVVVNNIVTDPVNGSYAHIMNPWNVLLINKAMPCSWLFYILSIYFFYQSLFILGAILWPKRSFLKTIAAIWILQMILGIFAISTLDGINFEEKMMLGDSLNIFAWLGAFMCALTLVAYYLAYLRFKRSQVIYKLF